MHRWAQWAFCAALLSMPAAHERAEAAPPAEAPDPNEPLNVTIERALGAEFLSDATMSVQVVDLADHKVLFERNANKPLNPASNVKLLTTAAALSLLGPEHRYVTRVYANRDQLKDGVLSGDLYLRGGGDPALVTGELYELARRLRDAGVREVDGRIVVDTRRFSGDGWPPGFDQKAEFAAYRAPAGAASVNFNTFEVRARPSSTGQGEAQIAVDPPLARFELVNSATTTSGRRNRLSVAIDRDAKPWKVRVSGSIGTDAGSASYRYPVEDPAQYAGEVFRHVLRQAGVKVKRPMPKVGRAPDSATLIATHRSEPLSVLARSINKLSNNFMAEHVLQSLPEDDGATAQAGIERVREWLASVGVPSEGLRYGNGSGLYDTNRISAEQLVAVLAAVHGDFRIRSDFLASLAVFGREGTLRRRGRDSAAAGWIRGKTGTLDGVSALSGYAAAPGREPIAFSIVFNELGRWETGAARRVQNQIAEAIANHAARSAKAD